MAIRVLVLLTIVISSSPFVTVAEDWPQFRGPGGRAVSETARPPIHFDQASNVVWKVAVPIGFSSPVVTGQRIFLTAVNNGWIETLCLDRKDGRVLWRTRAPGEKAAQAQTGPNPATPSAVTDGKSVYVLFGLFGVIAYDLDGKEQWREPLAKADEETSASPILIDDKLIIVSDKQGGSFVEARNKKTGGLLWRTERPQFGLSRATPFHWVNDKRDELILAGSLWLTSYNPRTGQENWRYAGTSKGAASSPAASETLLFAASPKDEVVASSAAPNSSGVGDDPISTDPFADFGLLTQLQLKLPKPGSGVFAIRSCGRGDITTSHLAWKSTRSLPGYSSPVVYKGRLFTVKDGGLVSAYNFQTGEPIYQDERLDAPGGYYASAVAAADRVYFTSEHGSVTVIDATAKAPTILAQNKLGQETMATPALIDQTILFRTATNLYSFGAAR